MTDHQALWSMRGRENGIQSHLCFSLICQTLLVIFRGLELDSLGFLRWMRQSPCLSGCTVWVGWSSWEWWVTMTGKRWAFPESTLLGKARVKVTWMGWWRGGGEKSRAESERHLEDRFAWGTPTHTLVPSTSYSLSSIQIPQLTWRICFLFLRA